MAKEVCDVNNGTVTIQLTVVNDPAELSLQAAMPTYIENNSNYRLLNSVTQSAPAANAHTFRDLDSPNFDTGSLTVSITNNMTMSEAIVDCKLSIDYHRGKRCALQRHHRGKLVGRHQPIATRVVFNAASSANAVEQILEAISYRDTSDNPTATTRQIYVQFNDGDGGGNEGLTTANLALAVQPCERSTHSHHFCCRRIL